MTVFWQALLAVFAAVGLFTVLYTVYEIIFSRLLQSYHSAELILYGDGCDASSEQLIRAAVRIRKHYIPGISITFVEIGNGQGKNVAKHMAIRQNIMYLK